MIMKVYAVLDKAVGAYLPPLCFRSHEEAGRAFADACVREGSQFFGHTSDYSLWQLGSYDDAVGVMHNLEGGPQLVVSGATLGMASPAP